MKGDGFRRRPQWLRVFRLLHGNALFADVRRTLVAVAGVAVGVSLVVAVTVLQREVRSPFDAFGPSLIQAKPGHVLQITPDVQGRLRADVDDRVQGAAGVNSSVPVVGDLTPLLARPAGRGSQRSVGVFLVGTTCAVERLTGPFRCAEIGRTQPAEGAGTPIALTRPVASALGIGPGDALDLPGRDRGSAHVGWVIDATGPLARLNGGFVAFTPAPADAAALLGRPGFLTDLFAITDGSAAARDAVTRAAGPAAVVHPPAGRLPSALVSVSEALGGVAAAGIVIGALIALNTLTLAVEDRRRVMGTIAAVGASDRRVFGGLVGEGVIIGAAGGLVGAPFGYLIGHTLVAEFGSALLKGSGAHLVAEWHPRYLALGVGAGIACGVLAMVGPARRVVKDGALAAMQGTGRARGRGALPLWTALGGAAMAALAVWMMTNFGAGRLPFAFGTAGLFFGVLGAVVLTGALAPRVARVAGSAVERLRPGAGTLLVADLDRYPGMFGGTCATLAIGAAVAVGFSGVQALGTTTTQQMMDHQPMSTALVVQAQGLFDQREGVLSDPVLTGIQEASGRGDVEVRYRAILPSATVPRLVIGVEPGSWYASALVRLHDPAAAFWDSLRRGEVGLSELAAHRLGAKRGDRVVVDTVDGPRSFRVAGTFATAFLDDASVGDWILTSPSAARAHWAAVPQQAAIRYRSAAEASARIDRVSGVGPGLVVLDPARWRTSMDAAWRRYFQPFAVTGYVILLAAAVAVLNMFLQGLVQKRRERAVLQAIGMEVRTERSSLWWQATLLAGCGVIFGAGCSQLLVYLLTRTSRVYYGFQVDWSVAWNPLALGAVAVVVMAFAGVAIPLVHAGRLDVVAGLRAE